MLHTYKCFQRSRTVLLVCIIHKKCFCDPGHITQFLNVLVADSLKNTPETNEIGTHICSCHNFFPLSSVQIIIIPACCLLCVL